MKTVEEQFDVKCPVCGKWHSITVELPGRCPREQADRRVITYLRKHNWRGQTAQTLRCPRCAMGVAR